MCNCSFHSAHAGLRTAQTFLAPFCLFFFTSSFFLLLPRSSDSPEASVEAFLLPSFFFSSFSLCFCMNSAIRSGQSRFSSGSHVLSSLEDEVSVSTCPFTPRKKTVHVLGFSYPPFLPLDPGLYTQWTLSPAHPLLSYLSSQVLRNILLYLHKRWLPFVSLI